nr:hypothetical protein BaRGS_006209 [Batillaria attramentaria]
MVPGYKQNLVPQMVDAFPRDPVLEELVKQQIGSFGKLPCTVCPDKNVSMICRDCGDQYCDECSYAHAKMTFSLEHVQLDVEKIFKAPPVKHEGEIPSVYSPCGGMNREMLVHEAGLCQDGVSRLQNAISIITSNIARLRESRNRLEADRQLVVTYTAQLKKPNDVLLSSTRVMLPRLKCLREDCRPPNPGALARLTPYVESLTRPLPGIASANVEVFPALTAVPKRGFLTTVEVKEDFARKGPLVKAIVAKENGKLIVTDENNKMIKVLDVSKPGITCVGISLGSVPRGLTLLHDNPNKVAVTTDLKCIYFLDVGSFPKVINFVQTARQYRGVASVREDNTLVVGCNYGRWEGPACVDVVTQEGVVLKTVDDKTLSGLLAPENLCVWFGDMLVSDNQANCLYRLKMDTGCMVAKLTHPDLQGPCQVTTDYRGNCYIACPRSQCVLVVTPAGEWRKLLHGPTDGDPPRVQPYGVYALTSHLAVAWHYDHSVVALYNLM